MDKTDTTDLQVSLFDSEGQILRTHRLNVLKSLVAMLLVFAAYQAWFGQWLQAGLAALSIALLVWGLLQFIRDAESQAAQFAVVTAMALPVLASVLVPNAVADPSVIAVLFLFPLALVVALGLSWFGRAMILLALFTALLFTQSMWMDVGTTAPASEHSPLTYVLAATISLVMLLMFYLFKRLEASLSLALQEKSEVALRAAEKETRLVQDMASSMIEPVLDVQQGLESLLRRQERSSGELESALYSANTMQLIAQGLFLNQAIAQGAHLSPHQSVDLDGLLARMEPAWNHLAEMAGVKYRFSRGSALPGRVDSNALLLEYVLGTLVANSLQNNASGSLSVVIKYRNNHVILEVVCRSDSFALDEVADSDNLSAFDFSKIDQSPDLMLAALGALVRSVDGAFNVQPGADQSGGFEVTVALPAPVTLSSLHEGEEA